MASCGESESEDESKSGSDSDSRSDLKASGNSSSRCEDGKGAVQPVAVRAISQPSSKRAKKRKEKESSPESQPEDGTGTVQPVHARACSQPSFKRLRKGGGAGKGTGPSAGPSALRIGELFEISRILCCWGNGGGMPASPRKGRHAGAPSKLPEEESEEKDRASMSSLSQLMGLDEEVLRVGMRMIDSSKVEEIKDRLREYRMAVLQMGVDRAVLTNDIAKLFMDGYRAARK